MKKEICFAKNLRIYRKKMGLTRHELAEYLHYSDKAVEKWETGQSVPTLDTICKLSEVLGVNLEQLIYAQDKEIKYFLGIDGGGTKTTFLLENTLGKEVALCELGPSNPNDVGMEQCALVLKQGISQVTAGMDRQEISVFAGMAGGISGENAEKIKRTLAGFEFGLAENGSDVENVLEMCLQGKDGIVIIAGTGSIAFAQKDGKRKRIGGWGYLLDEGGSGYNLGRDALSAAYRTLDGRGKETALLNLLEEEFQMSLEDAIPQIYNGGKCLIASLAPCVFEACDIEDEVAIEILRKNLEHIVELIKAAQAFMESANVPVVICGGLTKRTDLLEKYIQELLPQDSNVQFCDAPIVTGAIMLAKKNYSKEEYHGKDIY